MNSPFGNDYRNRVQNIDGPLKSPFVCKAPYQLIAKCFNTLFNIGINVMKFVATGTSSFPVYPFELLQVWNML